MNESLKLAEKIAESERTGKNVERFRKLINKIPKAEIHIHIESLMTPGDLLILNNKYDLYPECNTEEELKEALGIKKIANLSEMIQQFLNIQSFIKEEDDFSIIGESILPYMQRNNIAYLEGHLAVSSFVKRGLDFNRMMASLDSSLEDIAQKESRETGIFIDVSRTFGPENAMHNLDLLIAYLSTVGSSRIIGIGLGGAEKEGDPEIYEEIFSKARKAGLRCVAHAGEISPPTHIRDTLNYLKPERIGHGISAFKDEKLLEELAESQIPLEVCPTSNLLTKTFATKMNEHPITNLYNKGLLITLNTDDPLLFEVELNKEYEEVYSKSSLTLTDMIQLLLNTVKASFMNEKAKTVLLNRIEEELLIGLKAMK